MTNKKEEPKSRAAEMRIFEKEENFDMEYRSPLDVPASVRKEGYDYVWVCLGIGGVPDSRFEKRRAQHWTPVPRERDGSEYIDYFGTNEIAKKFICNIDVILMERSSVYGDREKAQNAARQQRVMSNLEGVENDNPFSGITAARIQGF